MKEIKINQRLERSEIQSHLTRYFSNEDAVYKCKYRETINDGFK